MSRVEVNLLPGGTSNCRRQNRQAPIGQSSPAQSARRDQNRFAFPERSKQNRKIAPTREKLHGHALVERAGKIVHGKHRDQSEIQEQTENDPHVDSLTRAYSVSGRRS